MVHKMKALAIIHNDIEIQGACTTGFHCSNCYPCSSLNCIKPFVFHTKSSMEDPVGSLQSDLSAPNLPSPFLAQSDSKPHQSGSEMGSALTAHILKAVKIWPAYRTISVHPLPYPSPNVLLYCIFH